MKTVRGISRRDFDIRFGNNEQCLAYLSNEKWGDTFECSACKHTQFVKGKKKI